MVYCPYVLIIVITILRVLDVYYTFKGIDEGWFIEGNPIYSPFIQNRIFIYVIYTVSTLILILLNIG
ncbi:MAG: DUF5658 family protein [Promethearchaeota archaeon]